MTESPLPPAGSEGVDLLAEGRFWINTVTPDHVRAAREGGFTQADQGAKTRQDPVLSRPLTALWARDAVLPASTETLSTILREWAAFVAVLRV